MSILIKGMDMPTQCYDCYLVANDPDGNGLYCKHLKEDIADWCRRLPNCPLVEVKTPHGRLKDADKVLEAMDTWDKFGFTHTGAFVRDPISSDYVPYVHYEDMVKCVEGMPAVIEAEE